MEGCSNDDDAEQQWTSWNVITLLEKSVRQQVPKHAKGKKQKGNNKIYSFDIKIYFLGAVCKIKGGSINDSGASWGV